MNGPEVAALGDVVVVLLDGGRRGVAFMYGEPVTREMDIQLWFERDGATIKTAQMTVRRHPKEQKSRERPEG